MRSEVTKLEKETFGERSGFIVPRQEFVRSFRQKWLKYAFSGKRLYFSVLIFFKSYEKS